VLISLAELRLQTRQRSDQEKSKLVKDSELTSYINSSIAELYDLLCEAYGSEYYTVESIGLFTDGTNFSYALPADLYELKGVDMRVANQDWTTLQQFNFNERNRYGDTGRWTGIENIRYRLVGNNIRFNPLPDANTEYRLWYVPFPVQLINDTDTLDGLNSYQEYVIVDAAIKMMQKEESDVSVLMAQKMALQKRIVDKAANRNAAQSGTISDVYAEAYDILSGGVKND
jgi:hypothetical protein